MLRSWLSTGACRLRGRVTGEELEHLLRGDGPHGRPARLAARLIRVLAELELVSLDRDLPALAIAGAAPTALERSPAYRVYAAAIRGRTTIPEQRKHLRQSRLSRTRQKDGVRRASRRGRGRQRRRPAALLADHARDRRSTASSTPTRRPTIERAELTDGRAAAARRICSRSSRSTRTSRPSRSTATGSRRRSCTPACTTPISAGAVGRGLHRPSGRRGEDLRRDAPRHRDAVRGAAARHGRGHLGVARGGAARRSARRSPGWSTASPSSPG